MILDLRQPDHVQAASAAICQLDLDPTWEYPGYISVPLQTQSKDEILEIMIGSATGVSDEKQTRLSLSCFPGDSEELPDVGTLEELVEMIKIYQSMIDKDNSIYANHDKIMRLTWGDEKDAKTDTTNATPDRQDHDTA